MIVAMSEVEVKKFQDALSYFTGNTGPMMNNAMNPYLHPEWPIRSISRSSKNSNTRILPHFIQRHNLEDVVTVSLTERGIHIVVTDSVMFRSGQADLIEPSRTLLKVMGGAGLRRHDRERAG